MIENRERRDGMGGPADFQDLSREHALITAETESADLRTFYPADDLREMILTEQGD